MRPSLTLLFAAVILLGLVGVEVFGGVVDEE